MGKGPVNCIVGSITDLKTVHTGESSRFAQLDLQPKRYPDFGSELGIDAIQQVSHHLAG